MVGKLESNAKLNLKLRLKLKLKLELSLTKIFVYYMEHKIYLCKSKIKTLKKFDYILHRHI